MATRLARDFFQDALAASKDAETCKGQLDAMERMATRLGGGIATAGRSPARADRMESAIVRCVDREESLRRRMDADYDLIDQATTVLYGPLQDGSGGLCAVLSPVYADVLWWRYLNDSAWKQVARAVGLSDRWCRGARTTAFEAIDEHDLLAKSIVSA